MCSATSSRAPHRPSRFVFPTRSAALLAIASPREALSACPGFPSPDRGVAALNLLSWWVRASGVDEPVACLLSIDEFGLLRAAFLQLYEDDECVCILDVKPLTTG